MIRFEGLLKCVPLPIGVEEENKLLWAEFMDKLRKYPPSRSCFDQVIEHLIQVNVQQ